jgi:Kdo2-lipid IVA lauroyltransferase/acyltransferase
MSRKHQSIPEWLHAPLTGAIRAAMSVPLIAGFESSVEVARAAARGYCGMRANRKRTARAIDHLRIAFPDSDWNDDRRHSVAVASYEHLFSLGVELAFTPRYLTEDGWSDHVAIGGVTEGVRTLLTRRPCVMITGHCGSWEVLGYTVALLGFDLHALYRPLDLRPLDAWLRDTRQARGLTLVDKFGALDSLPKILANGSPVGFVADQNAGDRGLFVPFFGRLASTYKSIGLLAMRFDAPVICGTARRLVPGTFRYSMDISDVIMPEDWADAPDPLFYLTARYRRALERSVRAAPEQYLWMHRIWKSRPRHEKIGKPFPGSLREKLRSLPWMTDDELARIIDRSDRDAREPASSA